MMVGLPGSGKSTISGELAKKYDAIVFSSDALREEMFGDINDQKHNQELFAELHKRIKTCLRNGRNAIYDACNINYKRRMAFLSELKGISCEKICVIMATPISVCHKRNEMRDRKVPANVITRMFRTFNLPYWYEGWDDIQIEYGKYAKYYGKPARFYMIYKDFDQRNSHHTLTLGEHCLQVSLRVGYDLDLVYAGMLHDCGKQICATTVNKNGKYDGNYHYYDHQYVGCYESLFYDFEDENPIDIAIIIMWHMQPYFNKEEKTKKKYLNLWGEELYEKIMKLHEADIEAH
jgi:predicted kinase/predicted HD phosphohydrolase